MKTYLERTSQDNITANTFAVMFSYFRPDAEDVFLSGSFNDWSQACEMIKGRDGNWTTTVLLVPGRHEYKFIVDGEWEFDAARDQKHTDCCCNEFGSMNATIRV